MRLKLAREDVVFEEFDGDLVVLDILTGRYFGFNDTATMLWHAFIGGLTLDEISASAPGLQGVQDFAERLIEIGLVVPTEEAPAGDPVAVTGLSEASAAPSVEVYDDLADLITADPIHDVDTEAGWPKARTA